MAKTVRFNCVTSSFQSVGASICSSPLIIRRKGLDCPSNIPHTQTTWRLGMDSAFLIHRLQFAFTVSFHYLFPQLTMGLALLIVILKTSALITEDEHFDRAARFWAKIFAINFAMG